MPESASWNQEFKTVLHFLTWGDHKVTACITPGGVGLPPTMAYFRRCPFHSSGILYVKGRKICLFYVCKVHFMAVKKARKCSGFVIYWCLKASAFSALKRQWNEISNLHTTHDIRTWVSWSAWCEVRHLRENLHFGANYIIFRLGVKPSAAQNWTTTYAVWFAVIRTEYPWSISSK